VLGCCVRFNLWIRSNRRKARACYLTRRSKSGATKSWCNSVRLHGTEAHLPNLLVCSRAEAVVVADTRKERLGVVREKFDVKNLHTDIRGRVHCKWVFFIQKRGD